jgi:hypothetical protein
VTRDSSTREREHRAYLFYHGDGILDIMVGVGILFAGLCLVAGLPWLVAVLPTTLVPVWRSAKRSITAPRATPVDVPVASQGCATRSLVILAILGMLCLGLGALVALGVSRDAMPSRLLAQIATLPDAAFGLPMIVGLAGVAVAMRIPRYFLYAALTAGAFAVGYLLSWVLWWSLVMAGAAVTLGGAVTLILFLRTHPMPGGEA